MHGLQNDKFVNNLMDIKTIPTDGDQTVRRRWNQGGGKMTV
jgi:hypothetical protein